MSQKPLDDKALVYRIDVPCETCSASIGEPCAPDCEENAGNVPEVLDGKNPVLDLQRQVKDLEAKVALLTLEKEKAYDAAIDAASKACEDSAEALDWARVLIDTRAHLREANALLESALEADPSEHAFGRDLTARIRAHLDAQSKVDCIHQHAERGKNILLLHGSYRSEVCVVCGAFRALSHLPPHDPIQGRRGRWRPQSEYEAATKEDEER